MNDFFNIYQRLLAVIEDVGAVPKTMAMPHAGGKKAHAIDEVVDALRPVLAKHGVLPLVSSSLVRDWDREVHSTDQRGNEQVKYHHGCMVEVDVVFVNVESPEDRTPPLKAPGLGLDVSDKSTGKAISYALKAFYLAQFQMRGQPDNEADQLESGRRGPSTSRRAPPPAQGSPSQWKKEALALAVQVGKNLTWGEEHSRQEESRRRCWELISLAANKAVSGGNSKIVTEGQKKRLFACALQNGHSGDAMGDEVHTGLGCSRTQIPMAVYDATMMMFGARIEGNEVVF